MQTVWRSAVPLLIGVIRHRLARFAELGRVHLVPMLVKHVADLHQPFPVLGIGDEVRRGEIFLVAVIGMTQGVLPKNSAEIT